MRPEAAVESQVQSSAQGDIAPSLARSLIDELEDAIASKDLSSRAAVMRRVTGLFMANSATLSDEHVGMFDEVMSRLLTAIDGLARASFGQQFARMLNAPPGTLRMLALDNSIDVAAPVLTGSPCISDDTLVETASTRSQAHLQAIAQRKSISETVTDVLVHRGDQHVVRETAVNPGAKFSDRGCTELAVRSQDDEVLACSLFARDDIPRDHLIELFNTASEAVRRQLRALDPRKTQLYDYMVSQAANQIDAQVRDGSARYAAARARVSKMQQAGDLTDMRLRELAQSGRFDETTIALSLMCDLSIGHVERVVVQGHTDQLLVLARSIGLSWETTKALILLRRSERLTALSALERTRASFFKLQPQTAQSSMQFYRLRARAGQTIGT